MDGAARLNKAIAEGTEDVLDAMIRGTGAVMGNMGLPEDLVRELCDVWAQLVRERYQPITTELSRPTSLRQVKIRKNKRTVTGGTKKQVAGAVPGIPYPAADTKYTTKPGLPRSLQPGVLDASEYPQKYFAPHLFAKGQVDGACDGYDSDHSEPEHDARFVEAPCGTVWGGLPSQVDGGGQDGQSGASDTEPVDFGNVDLPSDTEPVSLDPLFDPARNSMKKDASESDYHEEIVSDDGISLEGDMSDREKEMVQQLRRTDIPLVFGMGRGCTYKRTPWTLRTTSMSKLAQHDHNIVKGLRIQLDGGFLEEPSGKILFFDKLDGHIAHWRYLAKNQYYKKKLVTLERRNMS